MTTVFFSGSFNPFTRGHASIVDRALTIFDKVVIGIGINAAKADSRHCAEETLTRIKDVYCNDSRVEVVTYSCLTVEAAVQYKATALLRGVRSVGDYEYERSMADLNRRLSGIETVLLFAVPEMEYISSSAVRELQSYGRDVTDMLPIL